MLKFIRQLTNNVFQYQKPEGIGYLTQIRLHFSGLDKQKSNNHFITL